MEQKNYEHIISPKCWSLLQNSDNNFYAPKLKCSFKRKKKFL